MSRSRKKRQPWNPYLLRRRGFRDFARTYVRAERHRASAALRTGRTPASRGTYRHSAMWDYW